MGVIILYGERFVSIFERSRGEEVVLAGVHAKEHLRQDEQCGVRVNT